MPKVYLKFDLNDPDDREAYKDANNATKYKLQLDSIWDNVFRPKYKHGYSNQEINALLEDEKCDKLLDLLAELYRETLKEWED